MPRLINDNREKPIYSTTRFSDILAFIENRDFARVLYDDSKNVFVYADGWDYIHIFLAMAALDAGIISSDRKSKLSKNCDMETFSISRELKNYLLNQDSYSDVHPYQGFCIYTRDNSELFSKPKFLEIISHYKKDIKNPSSQQ